MKNHTTHLWYFFLGIAAVLLGYVDLFGGVLVWILGATVIMAFDGLATPRTRKEE